MSISLPSRRGYPLQWIAAVMLTFAAVAFVSIPNLLRARISANEATMMSHYRNATTFATTEEPIRQTIRTGAMELVGKNASRCTRGALMLPKTCNKFRAF
jgi:hypothetical protein